MFPVHRFVIALKSEPLDWLIEATLPDKPIEINCVHPKIFHQALLYIYTGTCDLLKCGECPGALRGLRVTKCKDVIEDDIDEDMSAFEYYSEKKRKGTRKEVTTHGDPVRMLHEAGKRFGLKTLCKMLDALVYSDGFVRKRDGKKYVGEEKLVIDRGFKSMHDVVVKSKNGVEIRAHKCVLAARLEYFNNLFAVRWNADSTRSTISLPIAHAILEKIIEFLYTDECKSLDSSNDIDFMYSLLIVADQLFIERLKELCEVALSQLLTLRNAAQMLNLSCVYNASQLKQCVMEFVCLNLPAFLENRSLETVEEGTLDDLTSYYADWNANLSKRVITPFSDAPSDEAVKSVSDGNPIVLKSDDSDQENQDVKAKNRQKVRVRRTSENKNKPKDEKIDVIIEVVKEQYPDERKDDAAWTKILKQKKIVQARLKAAATVKDEPPTSPDNFTPLSKAPIRIPQRQNSAGSSPMSSPLQSPNDSFVDSPLKSPTYEIPIQKMVKISQKQRKRLALNLDGMNEKQPETKPSPTSPKNPWKKLEEPKPVMERDDKPNIANIIASEKKQRENWTKMRAKPLIYTQV